MVAAPGEHEPEPAPTAMLAVLLVCAGVIAGALAGLLTRDGREGAR